MVAKGLVRLLGQSLEVQLQGKKRNLLNELKVCATTRNLQRGRELHAEALECLGCSCNHVANALVNMYAKCYRMADARIVFDGTRNKDVVSWTTLLLGYADCGQGTTALDMFERMKLEGCVPNTFTFVAALKACASLKKHGSGNAECLMRVRGIHSDIGCHLNIYVQNTLIDIYAKCGSMPDAFHVFDAIQKPDAVSWTALILGYAENGESVTALDMFARMKAQHCTPDCITFVAALKASGLLGALESGMKIHAEASSKIERHPILVTTLVDFYSNCGSMVESRQVFDSYPRTRDVTTWNALCSGYSRLGDTEAVFELHKAMQDSEIRPNAVTFLCMLNCCSHSGLVEKADEILHEMSDKFGIAPAVEHYSCMVDIFGRSNKLDDAMALLRSMPCSPNAVTWKVVLGTCRKLKNAGIAKLAFKSLVCLDDEDGAVYELMAHIYGSQGMREKREMLLAMRKELKAPKEPSGKTSWTNESGEVHTFYVPTT